MSQTPKPTAEDSSELVITRVFDAPRSLVFAAWVQKEHADRWFFPRDARLLEQDADVRVGGQWHMAMEVPGDTFRASGVYKEVVPNERLAFTHAWEGDDGKPEHWTLITVDFADHEGGKTLLTFRQAPMKSVESREGHRGGWSECFDRLDAYVPTIGAQ